MKACNNFHKGVTEATCTHVNGFLKAARNFLKKSAKNVSNPAGFRKPLRGFQKLFCYNLSGFRNLLNQQEVPTAFGKIRQISLHGSAK
jgi:hypothetical protein